MEVTMTCSTGVWTTLPHNLSFIVSRYTNGSNNDLQYWGLDYPPPTTYHSLFPGTPMEVTMTYSTRVWTTLPHNLSFIVSRYTNGSNNDLQYWGLDYPPPTTYHSLFPGTPMEVTMTYSTRVWTTLPHNLSFIVSRYTNGSNNDLQYWGLDYPPPQPIIHCFQVHQWK